MARYQKNEIVVIAPLSPEELLFSIKPIMDYVRLKKQNLFYDSAVICCPSYPFLSSLLFPPGQVDPVFQEFRPCPTHFHSLDAFSESQINYARGSARTVSYMDRKKIRDLCIRHELHFAQGVYQFLKMAIPNREDSTDMRPLVRESLPLAASYERELSASTILHRPIFFSHCISEYNQEIIGRDDWLRIFCHIAQGRHQTVAVPEF